MVPDDLAAWCENVAENADLPHEKWTPS
jgi:hypothetical protein